MDNLDLALEAVRKQAEVFERNMNTLQESEDLIKLCRKIIKQVDRFIN